VSSHGRRLTRLDRLIPSRRDLVNAKVHTMSMEELTTCLVDTWMMMGPYDRGKFTPLFATVTVASGATLVEHCKAIESQRRPT